MCEVARIFYEPNDITTMILLLRRFLWFCQGIDVVFFIQFFIFYTGEYPEDNFVSDSV